MALRSSTLHLTLAPWLMPFLVVVTWIAGEIGHRSLLGGGCAGQEGVGVGDGGLLPGVLGLDGVGGGGGGPHVHGEGGLVQLELGLVETCSLGGVVVVGVVVVGVGGRPLVGRRVVRSRWSRVLTVGGWRKRGQGGSS